MRHLFAHKYARRRPAQAIVELALSITFITFLLSAAVDLGLMFKTYQALENATAEATTYLSQSPLDKSCGGCEISSADGHAITNFRLESGENDGALLHVSSMRDLDANSKDDMGASPGGDGRTVASMESAGWITIDEADNSGVAVNTQLNASNLVHSADCANRTHSVIPVTATDPTKVGARCFIFMKAQAIYKPFFLLAPTLGLGQVTLRAYAVKPIIADQ